jgi:flavorubredoxin
MTTRPDVVAPPREIARNVHWIAACVQTPYNGEIIHSHISAYLIIGDDAVLMVDTGFPEHWYAVEEHLDLVLGDRQVDWIVPTHPELAHAGNLNRLLEKYDSAQALGQLTDYHVFFPHYADRLKQWPFDTPVDLGGGYEVTMLQAPVKDLPSTQWVYESSQQVLFVADAFGYIHPPTLEGYDEPSHLPGQCRMFSSEIPQQPSVTEAVFVTRNALSWTRFVDIPALRAEVARTMEKYPPRLVCPSHGNVVDELDVIEPVIFGAYQAVYDGYRQA